MQPIFTNASLGGKNMYVVEYSPSQRAFHFSTLAESIKINKGQFKRTKGDRMSDFVIVYASKSEKEAREECERLQEVRNSFFTEGTPNKVVDMLERLYQRG